MKTLYLHIGTPKTATTSLQHFCTENTELLKEKGYSYPIFPHKFKGTNTMRNGYFLSHKVYNEDRSRNFIEEEKFFRQGMDYAIHCFKNTDNVILSDEGIWNVVAKRGKEDLWDKLKKEADENHFVIKIIIYLRRQDSLASSWWNQKVKYGGRIYSRTAWEDFIKDPARMQLEYYEPIKKMEQVFGKENIIVRRFGRQYFVNNSIYEDFIDALGMKYSGRFKIAEGERNTALFGNTHEIKRVLNTLPEISHDNNVFFRRIAMHMSEERPELKSQTMLSSEEALEFMERFRDGNRKIMKEYFQKDEDLFEMDFSKNQKWTLDHTEMEKDIIRFFGSVTVSLREENAALKKRLDAVEKELAAQKKSVEDTQRRLRRPIKNILESFRSRK